MSVHSQRKSSIASRQCLTLRRRLWCCCQISLWVGERVLLFSEGLPFPGRHIYPRYPSSRSKARETQAAVVRTSWLVYWSILEDNRGLYIAAVFGTSWPKEKKKKAYRQDISRSGLGSETMQ